MKPILKIEMPDGATEEHLKNIHDNLKGSEVVKEYHILVVSGKSEFISIEIITASDISLHFPK